MYGWCLALCLALCLAGTTGVNAAPDDRSSGGLLRFRLSNGIQVLFQPRYDLDIALVSLYFPIRAADRSIGPAAARRLAALYLDTAEAGEDTPRQILATLNASPTVSSDGSQLCFHLRCLPDNLPRAVKTLLDTLGADRFREPFLAQAEERLREDADRYATWGWEEARQPVMASLAAGIRLDAACQTLENPAPGPEALSSLRQRALDPASVRIVLTGRGDAAAMVQQVAESTRRWTAPPPGDQPAMPPPASGFDFAEWPIPADPPRVVVFFSGPGRTSPQLPAFLLAGSLLADGMTSLAGRQMTAGDTWVPALFESRVSIGRFRSLFEIEILAPRGDVDEVERRFFTAVEMAGRGNWLAVDQERARHQAFVHVVTALGTEESVNGLILETGQAITTDFYAGWRQRLAAPNRNDIAGIAREFLKRERCAVLELPGGSGIARGFNARTFQETMSALVPISLRESLERMKQEPDIPLLLPPVDPATAFNPERIETVVASGLLRGPSALLAEKHLLPLVWFDIGYPGGKRIEPSGQHGLNSLALRQRLLGCRDAQERLLLEKLEMLGGRLRVIDEWEYSGIEAVFPAYFRRAATGLLLQILHRQDPAPADVARCLAFARWFGPDRLPVPAAQATGAAMADLYGAGNPFTRTGGDMTAISVESVTAHYAKNFARVLPVIALAGDFDGTELLVTMGDYVTGSVFTETQMPQFQPPFPERSLTLDTIPGKHLFDLSMPGPYGGDPDILRLEVLRWLFFEDQPGGGHRRGQFLITPLLARGFLQFQYIADGKDGAGTAADLLAWLKGLPALPINSWRLATAIKMTELTETVRLSDPAAQARWLLQNALWKSRLWDPKVQEKAVHKVTKDQLRDLLNRYFGTARAALARVPVSDACSPHETGDNMLKR